MQTDELTQLIRDFHVQREANEEHKRKATKHQKAMDEIGAKIIEVAKLRELSRLPVVEGADGKPLPSYQVADKTSVKTVDKAAVVAWCKRTGRENLLSLHALTLQGIWKEIAEQRGELSAALTGDPEADFAIMQEMPELPEGVEVTTFAKIEKRRS